jgi:hypothetical protein
MVRRERFVYDQSMDAAFSAETAAARIAAAIGEPARARSSIAFSMGTREPAPSWHSSLRSPLQQPAFISRT